MAGAHYEARGDGNSRVHEEKVTMVRRHPELRNEVAEQKADTRHAARQDHRSYERPSVFCRDPRTPGPPTPMTGGILSELRRSGEPSTCTCSVTELAANCCWQA
ncbi:hypothetical protein ISCGN_000873 [Ixodes scapularis]